MTATLLVTLGAVLFNPTAYAFTLWARKPTPLGTPQARRHPLKGIDKFLIRVPPPTLSVVDETSAKQELRQGKVLPLRSFRELLDPFGLEVVSHKEVPKDFNRSTVSLTFPKHWFPKKIYNDEQLESVKNRVRSEAIEYNVFDQVPSTVRAFEQLGFTFGGRAGLQPGITDYGRYSIHQFTGIFALWDDVFELDLEMGLASIDRMKRMVMMRSTDPTGEPCEYNVATNKAVQSIQSENALDKHFALWWDRFFFDAWVADVGLGKIWYKRLVATMLRWLDALEDEMGILCELQPDQIDLDKTWDIRSKSVGGLPIFDLLLNAAGFEPSDELYRDLQGIQYLYAKLVRQVNEIASIPKDIVDECGSLFTSTMLVDQASFDEVLEKFVGMLEQTVEGIDSEASLLLAKYDASPERELLNNFLVAVRHSSVGWAEWHLPSPTYSKEVHLRYNKVKIVNHKSKSVLDFVVGPQADLTHSS